MSNQLNFGSITLSGLLTIRKIAEAREALLEAFERNDHLSVDIGLDSDVDISGIQLLLAARIYAASTSKRLSLSTPTTGRMLDVMQNAGFLEQMTDEDRQFWLHEGAIQ